jgi:phosphatidate cytidylyltransferase
LLAVRTVTAAALIAGFVAALFLLERAIFALLIGAVLGWAAWEWAALCRLRALPAAGYAAACALLYALVAWASWPPSLAVKPVLGALAIAGAFWAVMAPILLATTKVPNGWVAAAGFCGLVPAGVAAIGLPPALLLAVLGLVWVSDTAAYLAGRKYGRRRLAPAISPGKTWEGAAAALAASVAYAVILPLFMLNLVRQPQGMGWAWYLAGAALVCVAGIVGDLFESWAKRRAGVKDSGRLLPGHGGVLDRIDSACAALPIGALLLAWWDAG